MVSIICILFPIFVLYIFSVIIFIILIISILHHLYVRSVLRPSLREVRRELNLLMVVTGNSLFLRITLIIASSSRTKFYISYWIKALCFSKFCKWSWQKLRSRFIVSFVLKKSCLTCLMCPLPASIYDKSFSLSEIAFSIFSN